MTVKELDRIYKISSPVKLGHIAGSYILYIKANVVYVCLSMCSLRFPNHVPTSFFFFFFFFFKP